MKTHDSHLVSRNTVQYGTAPVDGLNIAYREAGDPGNPKLVLLHGFPASSHQYRNLLPALADRFHVISPDYPPASVTATCQIPQSSSIPSIDSRM